MLRSFIKEIKREDGASLIIVAVAMSTVLLFASLTIDIGMAYSGAAEIQNVADAVALSLGSYLPVDENDSAAKAEIIQRAKEYAQKNGYENLTEENVTFTRLEAGKYKALTITLTKTSKTYLAKIVGVDDITAEKSATVSAVPAGSVTYGVPVGVSMDSYQDAMATGQTQHIVLKHGGGEGTNGFFGFIVIDGSNGNAAALTNMFKYGYPGVVSVGNTFPVATGNKASVVKDGVSYRYYQCRHFPYIGGCTVDHFVEDCPRVMFMVIYEFIDRRTVRVTGFAPFILELSPNHDEIMGSLINLNISYTEHTSEVDCGLYTFRLIG